MRKRFLAGLLCLMVLVSVVGCSSSQPSSTPQPAAPAPQKEVHKWDFLVYNGLEHMSSKLLIEFAEKLEAASDGQIEITVRPPGELPYKGNEFLRVTGEGHAQLSDSAPSSVGGDLKSTAILNLTYLLNTKEDVAAAMSVLKPQLDKELSAVGTKLLFYYVWPPQTFWGKDNPITTITALKNFKVRATSVEQADFVSLFGASPVTLVGADVPPALQTGVINGVLTAAFGLEGAKWYDSLNWGFLADLQLNPSFIVVNDDAYAALSPELQKTVDEVSAEFETYMIDTMLEEDKKSLDRLIKDHKFVINYPSDAEKAQLIQTAVPYWEKWAADKGAEAQQILKDIRVKIKK